MCQRVRAIAFSAAIGCIAAHAGIIDSASMPSAMAGRPIRYAVALPSNYRAQKASGVRYPVVYLLHPRGARNSFYFSQGDYPNADSLVDYLRYIFVMPDCGDCWWLDSPLLLTSRYSTFLARELKPHIDSLYATLTDRKNTGIAGHSMGGFGAFHNIIEHTGIYGAAFALKGGFDPTLPLNPGWKPYNGFEFFKLLGADTAAWERVNVLKNAGRLKNAQVKLGILTGTADNIFYNETRRLDSILNAQNIPHEYHVTNENHFETRASSFRKMTAFFDSVFLYASSVDRPPRKFANPSPAPFSGDNGLFNCSGRKLAPLRAGRRAYPIARGRVFLSSAPGAADGKNRFNREIAGGVCQ